MNRRDRYERGSFPARPCASNVACSHVPDGRGWNDTIERGITAQCRFEGLKNALTEHCRCCNVE